MRCCGHGLARYIPPAHRVHNQCARVVAVRFTQTGTRRGMRGAWAVAWRAAVRPRCSGAARRAYMGMSTVCWEYARGGGGQPASTTSGCPKRTQEAKGPTEEPRRGPSAMPMAARGARARAARRESQRMRAYFDRAQNHPVCILYTGDESNTYPTINHDVRVAAV